MCKLGKFDQGQTCRNLIQLSLSVLLFVSFYASSSLHLDCSAKAGQFLTFLAFIKALRTSKIKFLAFAPLNSVFSTNKTGNEYFTLGVGVSIQ